MTERSLVRVGVLGYGAIGRTVSAGLRADDGDGYRFAGVVCRSRPPGNLPTLTLDEALRECDLLVEAAGQDAVAAVGERVLTAGVDLVVASVGALADPELAARLGRARPGRLYAISGAIGGLGLLSAAAALAPFDTVCLTSTKLPRTLAQPWMDAETLARLERGDEALDVFRSTAREAARRFPRSSNVAAALALALDGWDTVEVVVRADPAATLTRHVIEATSSAGRYAFDICNTPDPANPATSAVVGHNMLRAVRVLLGRARVL